METGISNPQNKQYIFHQYAEVDHVASGGDVDSTFSVKLPFPDATNVTACVGASLAHITGPISAAQYRVRVLDAVARSENNQTLLDISYRWFADGAGEVKINGIMFSGVAQRP